MGRALALIAAFISAGGGGAFIGAIAFPLLALFFGWLARRAWRKSPVRRALAGDAAALREIRIEALSDSPEAFGSTLEREVTRPPADWASWLSSNAVYFLDTPAGPKGLVVGVPDKRDPKLVWLMAMWLHPELRGTGAAGALVDAVLAWGAEVGAERIRLDVIEGNRGAVRLYEKHGFRPNGHTFQRDRDAAVEIQMERGLPVDSPRPRSTH